MAAFPQPENAPLNNRIRQQFPALQQRFQGLPLSYLDSAATTQKPVAVITALQQFYRRDNANVHRAGYQLAVNATQEFEVARAKVAAHFGARAEQLIWTKGCTEAINLVAQSWAAYQLQQGDVILVSGLEHHANLIPWQQVCKLTGARLEIIPVMANGELDGAAYQALLQLEPKLVAVAHVSNVLGTQTPIKDLIQQAHHVGAKVLVDGAQAAAHLDIDIEQLGADFYTFSGHKMYGPTGIGGLLAKVELLEQFEPWQTGGEMVEQVSYQEASWAELPFRLEAGTPNIAGAVGLAKAVDFIGQLPDGWQQQEAELLAYARQQLKQLPYIQLIGDADNQVAVQSFVSTQMPAQDVAIYLDQQGVAVRLGKHCAHPLLQALGQESTLRLSLACYTSQQDIDQLIQALELAHDGETVAQSSEAPDSLALEEILNELERSLGWQQRLATLIRLGKLLPQELTAEHKSEFWVRGCESQTWLQLTKAGESWHCRVDSDANVVKGVLHVLALTYNALSLAEQEVFDGERWLAKTGLLAQLSTTRTQGLLAIMERLKQLSTA